MKWLVAPRLPYRVDENNIFKKGNSVLIEVPLSALFFPYVGTTMRIFPFLTSIQRLVIHIENLINKKPVVFDIHPNEFIDESYELRVINRRTNNPVSYFLKDFIRSHIKVKNLGKKAIPLYKKEILFFKNLGYNFTTLRQYCEELGLL